MNDYDKYQEKINVFFKKKSLNSRAKSRSSIIISLRLYSLSKISGVVLKQKLQKRSLGFFFHIFFYTKQNAQKQNTEKDY